MQGHFRTIGGCLISDLEFNTFVLVLVMRFPPLLVVRADPCRTQQPLPRSSGPPPCDSPPGGYWWRNQASSSGVSSRAPGLCCRGSGMSLPCTRLHRPCRCTGTSHYFCDTVCHLQAHCKECSQFYWNSVLQSDCVAGIMIGAVHPPLLANLSYFLFFSTVSSSSLVSAFLLS